MLVFFNYCLNLFYFLRTPQAVHERPKTFWWFRVQLLLFHLCHSPVLNHRRLKRRTDGHRVFGTEKSDRRLTRFYSIGIMWKADIFGAYVELKKKSMFLASSCLCVRMENLGSYWIDFHEIWYFRIFRKNVSRNFMVTPCINNTEHFLLPTDAHNVKKRKVIKKF